MKELEIAKREFLVNIRRKEFLFATFGLPVLMAGIMFASFFFTMQTADRDRTIGYVDMTGSFEFPDASIQADSRANVDSPAMPQKKVKFVEYMDNETARRDLLNRTIDGYVIIPQDYMNTGSIISYSLNSGLERPSMFVGNVLVENILRNTSPVIVERVKNPVVATDYRLDETGEIVTKGIGDYIGPFLMSLLLAFAIFTSSGFLLSGIVEEKENRIIEVLLSSVTPRQLLTGKIIGLGSLGLLQLAIWLSVAGGTGLALVVLIPLKTVAIGLLYFLLGYIFYASIMAGLGSLATTNREGQQVAGIFTLIAMVPIIVMMAILEAPESAFSVALSIIPFTSPMTVILRTTVYDVPWYELAASIIVLVLSIIATVLLMSRVFRMGLLMYGKRPTIFEIIKILRQV
ncbi:MAG TPA: ABC transporter permease [Candidatus Methanoperedenaceae archaeon]|nr:ABC transporter permease [Candidatus Methanoperedenaceae archaeon]